MKAYNKKVSAAKASKASSNVNVTDASGQVSSDTNYYYITTQESDLNVRKSPDINGEKSGQISKGSVVTVSSTVDNWAYVTYYNSKGEEKSGWVCTDYITKCTGKYKYFADNFSADSGQFLFDCSAGKSGEAAALMSVYYPWAKNRYTSLNLSSYNYIGVQKVGNSYYYIYIDSNYDSITSPDGAYYFSVNVDTNQVTSHFYEGGDTVTIRNSTVYV